MEDSKYRLYEIGVNDFQKEEEKIKEFLSLFSLFTKYTYEERVAAMHELWGEIKDRKVFYYGNKCKVMVYIDAEKVYHFEFSTDNLNSKYVKEYAPDLYEPIMEPYYKKKNELLQIDEKQKETEEQKQKESIINDMNEHTAQQNINMLSIKATDSNRK